MYTARPMSALRRGDQTPPKGWARRWAALIALASLLYAVAMSDRAAILAGAALVRVGETLSLDDGAMPRHASIAQLERTDDDGRGAGPRSLRSPGPAMGAQGPRADAAFSRARHSSIRGGVVLIPRTFSSADGVYDLLLHFHGNTQVVRESAEVSGLNAVVAVINLGIGSGLYEDAYAVPKSYEELLAQIERRLVKRGLVTPRLRRVALSSWSAGYGAIATILTLRTGRDPLDALLVLDGIHVHFRDEDPTRIDGRPLEPFVRAARRAARTEILFTLTHSNIDPRAYAGAQATASYLLEQVGGDRYPRYEGVPPYVQLESAVGAVAKDKEKRMRLESEGHVGDFHVRGFVGETPEHHMAHLLQMAATALPELVARWTP